TNTRKFAGGRIAFARPLGGIIRGGVHDRHRRNDLPRPQPPAGTRERAARLLVGQRHLAGGTRAPRRATGYRRALRPRAGLVAPRADLPDERVLRTLPRARTPTLVPLRRGAFREHRLLRTRPSACAVHRVQRRGPGPRVPLRRLRESGSQGPHGLWSGNRDRAARVRPGEGRAGNAFPDAYAGRARAPLAARGDRHAGGIRVTRTRRARRGTAGGKRDPCAAARVARAYSLFG